MNAAEKERRVRWDIDFAFCNYSILTKEATVQKSDYTTNLPKGISYRSDPTDVDRDFHIFSGGKERAVINRLGQFLETHSGKTLQGLTNTMKKSQPLRAAIKKFLTRQFVNTGEWGTAEARAAAAAEEAGAGATDEEIAVAAEGLSASDIAEAAIVILFL